MAIKFDCPHCKQALEAKNDDLAGKTGTCPACNKEIKIPEKTDSEKPDKDK